MKANTHYWAIMDDQAVVVLFDGENVYAAGGWEVPVEVDRIVCEIEVPEEVSALSLYHGSY